ncbi:MAG TPA: hypothetical protein VHB77_19985 [Planctomycetaceae bacterium]|nr:hypothetical protein [Planctomycetaceae bacterium]
METITRAVRDLAANERSTVEQLVGHTLLDDQQVIIQIVAAEPLPEPLPPGDQLPDWCNVFEGMTDEEIADLEKSIFRSHASRSFE